VCVLRPRLQLTAPVLPPSVVGGKPCGLCRDELSFVETDLDYGRLVIREVRMAAWGNSHLPHCHVPPHRCQAASPCVSGWPRAWQLRAAPISIVILSLGQVYYLPGASGGFFSLVWTDVLVETVYPTYTVGSSWPCFIVKPSLMLSVSCRSLLSGDSKTNTGRCPRLPAIFTSSYPRCQAALSHARQIYTPGQCRSLSRYRDFCCLSETSRRRLLLLRSSVVGISMELVAFVSTAGHGYWSQGASEQRTRPQRGDVSFRPAEALHPCLEHPE
jgi:hypothetical protein